MYYFNQELRWLEYELQLLFMFIILYLKIRYESIKK